MIPPLDAPVTPDDEEARSWLTEELSRDEYSTELSPLTKGVLGILKAIQRALSGNGDWDLPVESIILVVVALVLVILIVIAVLNPVRVARRRKSGAVFDAPDVTLEEAAAARGAALADGRLDEAFVWAFRVLVLTLSRARVLVDGPGLTAHEASSRASRALPALSSDLETAADRFDAVRYGDGRAVRADVDSLDRLTEAVTASLAERVS